MSCVLANRVVLNVRKISKSVTKGIRMSSSRDRTLVDEEGYDDTGTSIFITPGSLSVYEMGELRRMRVENKDSQF